MKQDGDAMPMAILILVASVRLQPTCCGETKFWSSSCAMEGARSEVPISVRTIFAWKSIAGRCSAYHASVAFAETIN